MITFTETRKQEIIENITDKKILVIGDFMLDRYLWGAVTRISPEAPVPVVEIEEEVVRPGGAANVVNNLASLGATAIPVGVVGTDAHGEKLIDLFCEANFLTDGILKVADRITSVKTRIIAHDHHIVRADRENRSPISDDLVAKIVDRTEMLLHECDALIFQDYNKGLLTPSLIHKIIEIARTHDIIITVDPKFENFFEYRHVTVFKPNRKEAQEALGTTIDVDNDLKHACEALRTRLECDNLLLTLGAKGMCLIDEQNEFTMIPTQARKVHDVSGAGDTVIATLTAALIAGASIKEATTLANYAAGVVCSEVGVVPIKKSQLMEAIK